MKKRRVRFFSREKQTLTGVFSEISGFLQNQHKSREPGILIGFAAFGIVVKGAAAFATAPKILLVNLDYLLLDIVLDLILDSCVIGRKRGTACYESYHVESCRFVVEGRAFVYDRYHLLGFGASARRRRRPGQPCCTRRQT